MTEYHARPEGLRHRRWMRQWIVPRLFVGARIPSGEWLGRRLGIDASTAGKHMRRVLEEAGVATEVRRNGVHSGCRVYVTAIRGEAA